MNKIIKNKKILIGFLSLLFVIFSVATMMSFGIFNATATVFNGGELEEVYFVGQVVEIPQATFIDGSEVKSASVEIEFPDGSTHKTEKFTAEQYGTYKVRYYAEGGYEKIIEFSVNSTLYQVNGSGNATYGTYTVKNEYWSIRDGQDRYEEIDGVITSLGAGSKFVYNKTIDLSKLNADQPLITVNIIAQKRGTPDFGRLNIRVTDVHNPENFLILRIKDKQVEDPDHLSYCYVSINDEDVFYRGTTTTEGKYGISNLFSFRGMAGMRGTEVKYENNTSLKNDVLSYFVSHEKNEVFRMDSIGGYSSVCKLSETAAGWKGFTTGEVKIEVFAELYYSATADFIIREIAGDKLTDNQVEDQTAPDITVDYGEYTAQTIPFGKKGKSYKVFDATAYDVVDGLIKPEVFVYRNYNSNRISVDLIDGRFKTTKTGIYTICYVATDLHGNVSEELVEINVVDTENNVSLSFDKSNATAKQGEKVFLRDESVNGGFGNITVEKVVTFGQEKINVENESFVAMKTGEYTITYIATDYVGQISTGSYKVLVSENDTPVLATDLDKVLEKHYLVGFEYPMPEIKMYVFAANGEYSTVNAQVSVDNATVSGNKFTPKNEGEIKFIYSYNGYAQTVQRKAYSIKNGNNLDLNKMFIVEDGISVSYAENKYSKYFTTKDGSIEFINKLLADGFSVKFNTETGFANVQKINVYITDTENLNQVVKFSFINTQNGALFAINDSVGTAISTKFNGDQKNDFAINLTAESGEVIVDEKVFTILTYYNSDQKYANFDSNKVYCRIEFEGVSGNGFSFLAKNVSGQGLLSSTTEDKIRPVIVFCGEYGGIRAKGTEYELPLAVAGDVISPTLQSFIVSVYAPDGSVVRCGAIELEGVAVSNYKFKLDQYGEYFVKYEAKDAAGKKSNGGTFAINVYDLEPPNIKINGGKRVGKVGDSIIVASATISDNYATNSQLTVYVMVKNPKGVMSIVQNNKFKADIAGIYTVYYYVFDDNKDDSNGVSQGNLGSASYTVSIG